MTTQGVALGDMLARITAGLAACGSDLSIVMGLDDGVDENGMDDALACVQLFQAAHDCWLQMSSASLHAC